MSTAEQNQFEGPAWDINSEYPAVNSPEFKKDLQFVDDCSVKIESDTEALKPLMTKVDQSVALSEEENAKLVKGLQEISVAADQTKITLYNLMSYVSFTNSVDSTHDEGQAAEALLTKKSANFRAITAPWRLFLDRAPEELIKLYLNHPVTVFESFPLRRSRELADIRLSEAEETLLSRMRPHGIDAFATLYNKVSGGLRCQVDLPTGTQEMGLSKASGLLRDSNENIRRAAWLAIQEAWKRDQDPCAAILNGITGWRLEEYKRRSKKRKVHFLDIPVHNAAMERKTLDAIMQAIHDQADVGRRAARAIAKSMGKTKLEPWDLLAGATKTSKKDNRRTFNTGLGLVRDSFSAVDPELGEFVSMLEKNRWIDARVLPNKRQGAFCGGFLKSRTPRVFQTYMGSVSDIRTLAHEIGHAYHSWVMRDMSLSESLYPMTLAETASIFAEAVFSNTMAKSDDANARFEIAWQNAQQAVQFLLNIPARFDFEKELNEQRQSIAFLSPKELGDLTEKCWKKWYGDTITEPERQFWMTKLHFSMGDRAFYNFPYPFGALFSLSIFARREEHEKNFLSMYKNLLRDTGRMTAEEIGRKHLGEDITKPDFWYKGIDVMKNQVAHFETLLSH